MLLLGGGAGAGDQVLKNAWRIRRTFPKRLWQPLHPACSPALGPSQRGGRLSARPAPRSAPAAGQRGPGRQQAAGLGAGGRGAPPRLPFVLGRRRQLAAGLWPRPPDRPLPRRPRPSLPPPPAESLGEGGGDAQTRRPRLGAARNALKRRERGRESAAPECKSELKLPAGGEEERGEDEEERGEAQASWDPGRAHFSAKCQLPRRVPGAHLLGAEEKSAGIWDLRKESQIPPRPVPFPLLLILIKKTNNKNNSKLAIILSAPHSWHHEGGRRSQTDSHHHQDGKSRSGAFPLPGWVVTVEAPTPAFGRRLGSPPLLPPSLFPSRQCVSAWARRSAESKVEKKAVGGLGPLFGGWYLFSQLRFCE